MREPSSLKYRYEVASLLRSYGVSLLDIASHLYPDLYREYQRARGPERRRLARILKRRAYNFIRYARRRGLGTPKTWDPTRVGDHIDDSGGVRVDASHTAFYYSASTMHENPVAEKINARSRAHRLLIDMEMLAYSWYLAVLKNNVPSDAIWWHIKEIHRRAYPVFLEKYGKKARYWAGNKPTRLQLSYIYYLFAVALATSGLKAYTPILKRIMRDPDREVLLVFHDVIVKA